MLRIQGLNAATSIGPVVVDNVADVEVTFREQSVSLLSWPTTLGKDKWIERPEFAVLAGRIASQLSGVTLLVGSPGSGKSALLARLGQTINASGGLTLALKVDKLDPRIDSAGKLAEVLQLPALVVDCVTTLSKQRKVVVLLDQLDALADLVDLKSGRLNVILYLIHHLHGLPNVHVVCSCRAFEYHHDSRLAAIEAAVIDLHLPTWEQVASELAALKINALAWPEPLQELLRVPQHLKVFLERFKDTTEDLIFTSYQQMLEDLWRKSVLDHEDRDRRSSLLFAIANIIAERESLWVPFALFEMELPLIESLEAAGLLARAEGGSRIGFQHQTVFEFVRARAFAGGSESLAEFVLARRTAFLFDRHYGQHCGI